MYLLLSSITIIICMLIIYVLVYSNLDLKKRDTVNQEFLEKIDNVYCINLEDNKDRFLLVDSMAKNADLSLTRFDAKDTRGVKFLHYKSMIHPIAYNKLYKTISNNERKKDEDLTPGAIGCYLSHISLYKEALKRGEKTILVFEDDTQIPKNFKEMFLKKLKNLPEDWDMFLLGWWSTSKKNKKLSSDIVHIKGFILMHAYIINNIGMQKMLSVGMPIKKQIDHMASDNSNYINIYGTLPNGWIKQGTPTKNIAYMTNIQIPVKKTIENFSNLSHNLLVIVYENTKHPNAEKLKDLLDKRGFPFVFIGLGDNWEGFGTKTHGITNYINDPSSNIDDDTYIICLDSRDVICNGNVTDTLNILKKFDENKLIISTEKGCCVPSTTVSMRSYMEERASKKNLENKYLNAGMIAGKAKVFKKIYPFNMRKTDDDQTGLIKWWQDHPDDIELDYDELLFSNANFWNKDHEKGCPYKISKKLPNERIPQFIQTPAKFWKCYDNLYSKSKYFVTWKL